MPWRKGSRNYGGRNRSNWEPETENRELFSQSVISFLRMNIGLFGGTFDPIHNGHLAVAHAAAQRCKLAKVLFVPGDIPPHKRKTPVTEFAHCYAMVTLARQGEKKFFPSLLPAPSSAPRSAAEANSRSWSIRRLPSTVKR